MAKFHGTVLGGQRDGDIIVTDQRHLVLPEPVDQLPRFYTEEELPPYGPSWREAMYDFQIDDDGRGWWVRRRT